MGNKYVNFSVRMPDQHRVADVLQRAGRVAIITPPQNGYVVAYDQESSDTMNIRHILEVGTLLSRDAEALVLAVVNFDDDVLCYWLFEQGQLIDSFNSRPDYDYGPGKPVSCEGQGGDVGRICKALGAAVAAAEVEEVLRGKYVFAVEQHARLAELLGLPSWSVGFGFDYVPDEFLEEEMDNALLMYVK